MLVPVQSKEWFLGQLARLHGGYPHMFEAERGWTENGNPPVKYFVDDAGSPRGFAQYTASHFMLAGSDDAAVHNLLADLYYGRVDHPGGWPDDTARAAWEKHGVQGLSVNLPGLRYVEYARELGFYVHEPYKEATGAYFFYITGEPRFSEFVEHPCEVRHGEQMFDLMRQAVDYDPSGEYIRRCLREGPSFVCTVGGEPVCWSCTHINRCMGMIYTPPEHRRHGYARSLAAFQIDRMLKEDGIAHCFVLEWNKASQGLLTKLGASLVPEAVVWRHLGWRKPRRSIRRGLRRVLATGRKS